VQNILYAGAQKNLGMKLGLPMMLQVQRSLIPRSLLALFPGHSHLIPRPLSAPVFDHLQRRGKVWEI